MYQERLFRKQVLRRKVNASSSNGNEAQRGTSLNPEMQLPAVAGTSPQGSLGLRMTLKFVSCPKSLAQVWTVS